MTTEKKVDVHKRKNKNRSVWCLFMVDFLWRIFACFFFSSRICAATLSTGLEDIYKRGSANSRKY